MEGTCPGIVGVGDGARSCSGSGSSDSKSRSGGEGRVGPCEIGCAGGGFSRPESRAGEPWRLICSTMFTDRGRFEERAGAGSFVDVLESGAVEREACLERGAGWALAWE